MRKGRTFAEAAPILPKGMQTAVFSCMIKEKQKGSEGGMRRICLALLAALAAGQVFPAEDAAPGTQAGEGAMDTVIVMELSALGVLGEGTGDAPWFACPCLNEAHFYLAPAAVEAGSGMDTYPPAAPGGEGALSVYDAALGRHAALDADREYRFSGSFLTDPAARGFESWKYHFTRTGAGSLKRIPVSEAEGCFGRSEETRAAAAGLAEALIKEHPGSRAAVVPCGAAGDSRFATPLTSETEVLLAAIGAAPAEGGGDAAAGLAAALRILNRRPLLERLGRPCAVILLTGGDVFPPLLWERCASLVRTLEAPRGEASPVPFGVFLPESLACGAGAQVYAAGILTSGGGFFDVLASAGASVSCGREKEKAEAFASAMAERVYGEGLMRHRCPA